MNDAAQVVRVRHELRRRRATVARVEQLTPQMIRVTLRGEELQGFTSLGFDDHVKLIFPAAGDSRDYTPRRFDADAGELTIDFFVHADGPATSWAAQAAPGQTLLVGGPKGSSIIPLDGIESHLFVGDETALPAIGRRLEELPRDTQALVVAQVERGFEYPLASSAELRIAWVPRDASCSLPGAQLIDALRKLQLPTGRCFAWAAAESHAARAIRRYLTVERGFGKSWVKAAGYWQRGASGTHVVIGD
jgi:NADPH-dependent ferric siderophore reductase